MQVLKFKFGASGERVDAFGIRFFGDFDGRVEHGGTSSEILIDPDVPPHDHASKSHPLVHV